MRRLLKRRSKLPVNDSQFAALVSLCYNIGAAAFRKSSLCRKLNAGDYGCVPSELMKWVKACGKKLQRLANRRAAEEDLWVKGEFVASRDIRPKPARENPALSGRGNSFVV